MTSKGVRKKEKRDKDIPSQSSEKKITIRSVLQKNTKGTLQSEEKTLMSKKKIYESLNLCSETQNALLV